MSSRHSTKRISLKKLECELQQLDDFEEPKIDLEQYATPPHIAAAILINIDSHNDLEGKFVADLGCGCGRLSIGSVLLDASMVVGFDIDEDALSLAIENSQAMFNDDGSDGDFQAFRSLNFVQADITCGKMWQHSRRKFDTVLMNPPFGTKQNKGTDLLFLERALEICQNVVYSLHKTATRSHILKKCQDWGVTGKAVAQVRYNLESTYKFHKNKSVDIDVDLWRIEVAGGPQ